MSQTRWSLYLLSLTIVLVRSGQDDSNSAHYLFSSIRDLRLHQQQQTYPARSQIQNTVLRQISQPPLDSHVPSRIIRKDNGLQSQEFVHNEPSRRVHNTMQEPQPQHPPPLDLTRGELANLYENAIHKGNTVRFDAKGAPIQAAVHHLDENGHKDHSEAAPSQHEGDNRGYYYYYYPLKSFMHELSSHSHNKDNDVYNDNQNHHYVANNHYQHDDTDNVKSYSHDIPHVYEHTHQHNVHIEPMKADMDNDKKHKGLAPLFMAISGFIGVTVMFILSMLMLPKFGHALKSRYRTKGEDEVDVFRVVLSALEGEDCRERLACEMGKAASTLNLYDTRLVKFVRRIGPVSMRRRIDKIGKYIDKKFKCASIQCKRKDGTPKPKEMH